MERATDATPVAVFDLGGVLIDWNPRYLYRSLFEDDTEMEAFLRDVCSPAWIALVDAGQPFGDAIEELAGRYPAQRELIEAFHARWLEMLGGALEGTVEIVKELRRAGVRVFALSNWSRETFSVAEERFPFLGLFEGILISGDAGHAKPAREIFEAFLERFDLHSGQCLFIDDREENLRIAAEIGFDVVTFTSSTDLRRELVRRGLIEDRT